MPPRVLTVIYTRLRVFTWVLFINGSVFIIIKTPTVWDETVYSSNVSSIPLNQVFVAT